MPLFSKHNVYSAHESIGVKDLSSTSSGHTIPLPHSPVVVNGPGLESQQKCRSNEASYDPGIMSNYYAPASSYANDNSRISPQGPINFGHTNLTEFIPKQFEFAPHDATYRINSITNIGRLMHTLADTIQVRNDAPRTTLPPSGRSENVANETY